VTGTADDKRPLAFVAMRFDADPWRDRRYAIVKQVAEEAGYRVLRADEILTSGKVVDEVCSLLRDSALVILDTTGDSHSVAYELGFCHGIGRSDANVLLLRAGLGTDIPFNYRHFRFRCYRDLRHLRRVLRHWFALSVPLNDGQLGWALTFHIRDESMYGQVVADAVLRGLRAVDFTGRCEYYVLDDIFGVQIRYIVALGLRPTNQRKRFGYDDFVVLRDATSEALATLTAGVELDKELSEGGELGGIRRTHLARGACEFLDGQPIRPIGHVSEDLDNWSWFLGAAQRRVDAPTSTAESA
jgi:hypothetical protein